MKSTLNPAKMKALSDEIDATSSLFRHGFLILENYKFAARDADPVFVCLAGGAEKFLKLTVGLYELDKNGVWPSLKNMKKGWGHGIVGLDKHVQNIVQSNIKIAAAPGYIQGLLDEASSDMILTQTLSTLERYAEQGRFYNLDYLSDNPQPKASPTQLWEELHHLIIKNDPGLIAGMSSLSPEEWKAARSEINTAISHSIKLWCNLLTRSWMSGIIGPQAKQWSGQLGLTSD